MEKYLSANQIAEFLGLQNLAFRNELSMASYPKGKRFSKRCTRWKKSDVLKALEALKGKSAKKATARY